MEENDETTQQSLPPLPPEGESPVHRIVTEWFNSHITASPVSGDEAAFAAFDAAQPDLAERLSGCAVENVEDEIRTWLTEKIFNTAVSRNVAALTHLTARLPALVAMLAARHSA